MTGLLITDEAATAPRTTFDVDASAEITSYTEYTTLGGRLRAFGFREDASNGAPLYRWVHERTVLDLMPPDENILGFRKSRLPLRNEIIDNQFSRQILKSEWSRRHFSLQPSVKHSKSGARTILRKP